MNETEINIDMVEGAINGIGSGESSMLLNGGEGLVGSGLDLGMIQAMGVGLNIFQIVTFLLTAWGLYMISKKLGEKYSWLSFIPLLQLYNYFSISKVSVAKTLVYPLISIIIGGILAIFTFGITLIIAILYLFVMIVKLYSAISTRCGRGNWTTVGFLLIPFIMFPIVGSKLEDISGDKTEKKETKKEEVTDTESTDDIEY